MAITKEMGVWAHTFFLPPLVNAVNIACVLKQYDYEQPPSNVVFVAAYQHGSQPDNVNSQT